MPKFKAALHPGQMRARESEKKVVLAIAGTGGGKTRFSPLWAYEEHLRILKRQGGPVDGIVCAPHKILVRTTRPAFLALFQDKLELGEWENKQEGIWRFYPESGGGAIYFTSADTPESIEGAHVHWAVMDEFGQRQFPEEAFRSLERRVRFNQGRILGTTTPYVVGWMKRVLYDPWQEGDRDDIDIIQFPSTENPKFPVDEFERARATLPTWQFNMFYLGQWDRPQGLIFGDLEDCWIDKAEVPKGWKEWDEYAGVDFGFNNPQAHIYGLLSPDDVLYIYEEYYESNRTDSQNAIMARRPRRMRTAWGDPSSPEGIAEFQKRKWPLYKADKRGVSAGDWVREGILEVIDRARTGRLKLVRGMLAYTSKEIDGYVWDEKNAEAPIKRDDHLMDALRYLCWGLRTEHTELQRGGASTSRLSSLQGRERDYPDDDADARHGTAPKKRSASRIVGLPGRRRRS